MNRIAALLVFGILFCPPLMAEDAAPTATPEAATTTAPAATPEAAPAAAPAAQATVVPNTENLEFVSGEISVLEESSSSVTVKLYGENDATAGDKTLKVTVDANTDITDGEQDRDLKSLTVGTEVDVEYDPATNKATYIFVY